MIFADFFLKSLFLKIICFWELLAKKIAHLMFETLVMHAFMCRNDISNARNHGTSMRVHLEFRMEEIKKGNGGSLLFRMKLNCVDGIMFGFDGGNVFFS